MSKTQPKSRKLATGETLKVPLDYSGAKSDFPMEVNRILTKRRYARTTDEVKEVPDEAVTWQLIVQVDPLPPVRVTTVRPLTSEEYVNESLPKIKRWLSGSIYISAKHRWYYWQPTDAAPAIFRSVMRPRLAAFYEAEQARLGATRELVRDIDKVAEMGMRVSQVKSVPALPAPTIAIPIAGDYDVISADTIEGLIERVRAAIKADDEGRSQPLGGVAVLESLNGRVMFYQAMVETRKA